MLWLLPALLLAAAWFAPVKLRLLAVYPPQLRISLELRVLGLRLPERMLLPRSSAARPGSSASDVNKAELFRRLTRHLQPERLTIAASLSLADTAHAAQLCGLLNSLPLLLPACWQRVSRIAILPDFWSGSQHLHAECMVSSRLGILLTDAALLWLSRFRRSKRPAPRR